MAKLTAPRGASRAPRASRTRRAQTATTATTITAAGDSLSVRQLAALATEAETGYDLTHAKRRRVGRPSLGSHAGVSPRVSFRASPTLYAAARRRAARDGLTVSQLAREAMERFVSSRP